MVDHPGQSVGWFIGTYRPDGLAQALEIGAVGSRWEELRYPAFATRTILRYATAPLYRLDRAAARIAEDGRRFATTSGPWVDTENLAVQAVAGRAVALEALMGARHHRLNADYLDGYQKLGQLMGEAIPQLIAPDRELDRQLTNALRRAFQKASNEYLRGAADWLAAQVSAPDRPNGPTTPWLAPGPLADLINTELDARAYWLGAPLAEPVIVPGHHAGTGTRLKVGDAVRIPVPAPAPLVVQGVCFPMAKHGSIDTAYTTSPHFPDKLAGIVVALPEPGTVSVAVAGYPAPLSVSADTAQRYAQEFPRIAVDFGTEQVTDPLAAAELMTALYAWGRLDISDERWPSRTNGEDYDRLAAALARWTGMQTVQDLVARMQHHTDTTTLARFCEQNPYLRGSSDLFNPNVVNTAAITARPDAGAPLTLTGARYLTRPPAASPQTVPGHRSRP